ncbi:hypothetical protein CKO15_01005 [Halorhodospira abdelmalekii]|uniref:hypothetical protein n=1 Tax=Halorhodospira abdelmalekii TaxID=421629 RepID=UPI0019032744|nr:hypothetical protein [Halorhodospira abdelmalekii]MBK1733879.1 hypothetical protein [Halorhodospira abdelmalekii]
MTIVSHRYQFVFVKTRKTAGSSLELALAKHLGPDDVITPVAERMRARLGFPGPQNDRLAVNARPDRIVRRLRGYASDAQWEQGRYWRQVVRDGLPAYCHQHMSAQRLRQQLGAQRWRNYFTFTIERNPYALAVSRYRYRHRQKKAPDSFRAFLDSGIMARKSNFRLYSDGARPLVDRIVRYENLREELTAVSEQIGYPEDIGAIMADIHTKGSGAKVDYREYYDDACREIVARECAREIEWMGYRF